MCWPRALQHRTSHDTPRYTVNQHGTRTSSVVRRCVLGESPPHRHRCPCNRRAGYHSTDCRCVRGAVLPGPLVPRRRDARGNRPLTYSHWPAAPVAATYMPIMLLQGNRIVVCVARRYHAQCALWCSIGCDLDMCGSSVAWQLNLPMLFADGLVATSQGVAGLKRGRGVSDKYAPRSHRKSCGAQSFHIQFAAAPMALRPLFVSVWHFGDQHRLTLGPSAPLILT